MEPNSKPVGGAMINDPIANRRRPAALALVEAFDRSMSRDDLQDLDDDELRRFAAVVYHWEQLAAREKDRRRAGRP